VILEERIVGPVGRIVVGVHGTLGSLQALRWAAAEARERQVPLVAVIAWIPPGGGLAERSHPSAHLRRLWRDSARGRLIAAFDDGLGGIPEDLRVLARVERGDSGPALVDVASQPGDLLVIGTGSRHPVRRALRRSVSRYCLKHAKCPVLAVPPSDLMDKVGRTWRRSWSLRELPG
jgi:nucleotide-binding universal stress UspA family protein